MDATSTWPPLPARWKALVAAASSEEDLSRRLRDDPEIVEVHRLPYLLKTSPPRIEFALRTAAGRRSILTIGILPAGGGFRALGWRAAEPGP
ncbi:MAG: hypothetical protein KDF64_08550 [Geminicoccaceae bacterium]|nr:hypothetical protein [Geminicoccaceae bacterium]